MKKDEQHHQPAFGPDPQQIDINDFDYELPAERIARHPLPERDSARLLLYRGGSIGQTLFRELPAVLPQGALLLFNNTRVIHARLIFNRPTGARIEVFCLEPLMPFEHQQNLSSEAPVDWICLIGNNKRWKERELTLRVQTPQGAVHLFAERVKPVGDAYAVRFRWDAPCPMSFGEVLHHAGLIPLPPYLQRESTASDEDRYQTVYARQEGSVAAPTAGLHFTERVLQNLGERGIESAHVTLHVGAGTFLPVKARRLAGHQMHEEQISVSRETIGKIREAISAGRPVIPVGTTSLRTLETLYWCGVKNDQRPGNRLAAGPLVGQWDPYQLNGVIPPAEALTRLLVTMEKNGQYQLCGPTQLLIAPGYRYRLAGGLITNFHQPRSTLLLLIAALVGDDWHRIYDYALQHDFRFLSYGDSSLLLPG